MESLIAYAKYADTYNLRQKTLSEFETKLLKGISTKEINQDLPKKKE